MEFKTSDKLQLANKTIADKFTSPMLIHKINSSYRLQLVIETFGHSTNKPTNQNSLKVLQSSLKVLQSC